MLWRDIIVWIIWLEKWKKISFASFHLWDKNFISVAIDGSWDCKDSQKENLGDEEALRSEWRRPKMKHRMQRTVTRAPEAFNPIFADARTYQNPQTFLQKRPWEQGWGNLVCCALTEIIQWSGHGIKPRFHLCWPLGPDPPDPDSERALASISLALSLKHEASETS